MTIFGYVSDLHLGFYPRERLPQFSWHPDCEVLLLAGDIMDGVKPLYIDWVLRACEGRRAFMTIGNHELYGGRRDKAIRELKAGFVGSHVQLLVNDTAVIDGIRIAGTDLWTNFALHGAPVNAGRYAEHEMSDYRRIRFKADTGVGNRFRRLRAADTIHWHQQARQFIRDTLESSLEPVVVMTHHAPSAISLPEAARSDRLAPAYATNMEADYSAAELAPVVHIHGHIHSPSCYRMRCGTQVLANPSGYHGVDVSQAFDEKRIFSLDHNGKLAMPQ